MKVGLSFTKVVIIQSLEDHETQTGRIIKEHVEYEIAKQGVALPVQFLVCESRLEFLEHLNRLTLEAKTHDHLPLLHVECHGDSDAGLEFSNSSTIGWAELSAALLELNIATRFNLLTIFSACYGGYFLSQMGAIKQAPCFGIVAPTEKIDPGDILQGFRVFYSALFSRLDIGLAIYKISQLRISSGYWFGEDAEGWFEKMMISYIQQHCSNDAVLIRARRIFRRLKDADKYKSLGEIKRHIRHANRAALLDKYFRLYFSIGEIPENESRFAELRKRICKRMSKFRSTNKYCI